MGLGLDADLALLLGAELTGFSGSHLNWNAELKGSHLKLKCKLLRLALKLKHGATQAHLSVTLSVKHDPHIVFMMRSTFV